MSKQLLKLKTEELILWNIAKSYWKKANGEAYDIDKIEKTNSSIYQTYTTFNKVYKQTLTYTIAIKPDYWGDWTKKRYNMFVNKNPEALLQTTKIKIAVPARRYDNVFLKSEKDLIKDYVLWNHYDAYDSETGEIILPEDYTYIKKDKGIRIYNLQKFDELIKVIYRELKKSVDNVGDLLRAEKRLIEHYSFDTTKVLEGKYLNKEPFNNFFIAFSQEELLKAFTDKIDVYKLDDKIKNDITAYLQWFRNNALHYKLQNTHKLKAVKILLDKINNDRGYIYGEKEWSEKE